MQDKKTRIVLVDDHHILLDGLTALLKSQRSVEVVGVYNAGQALLDGLAETMPDVVIADINMPGMNGHELTLKIKEKHPSIHIIALSMHDDGGHIMEMIEAGVSGYVLKNANDKELVEAIRTVMNGRMYFSPEVSDKITLLVKEQQRRKDEPEEARLTDRETEILKLIAQEYSNAAIADTLYISERTVETHRKNMMRKTNNKTVVGLLKYAMERKLI